MTSAHFAAQVPARAIVFSEAETWVMILERLPFVSEGTTVDDALADMISQLREYAEDWDERLRLAPNHQQYWQLVQMIKHSDDAQLIQWLEHP